MATRATLTVSDHQESYDIYRHWDGYPDGPHGVIQDIRSAVSRAWPQPLFEAGDFAAAIVARMKQYPGSVYLTRDANLHSDRAFHYDVTFAENALQLVVRDYASRIDDVIPEWRGTIDEAVSHFKEAEAQEAQDCDEPPDASQTQEHAFVSIPHEGIEVITEALSAAALDRRNFRKD